MKTTSEFLEITAASGGKKPSVKGLAYSGGKMRLFGWSRPVVVDMAGMNIPESVPLLTNHVNDTLCRVGVVTATKGAEGLEIAGEIVADGEEAENIIAQGKCGADWQARRSRPPNSSRRGSARSTGSNTMLRSTMSRSQPSARCPWSRWGPTRQLT